MIFKSKYCKIFLTFFLLIYIVTPVFADNVSQANLIFYVKKLDIKINRNWSPPCGFKDSTIILYLKINKDGKLVDIGIKKSSGSIQVDNAALETVIRTLPFGPLPVGYTNDHLDLDIKLNYISSRCNPNYSNQNVMSSNPVVKNQYKSPMTTGVIPPNEDSYNPENYLVALANLSVLPANYEVHVVSGNTSWVNSSRLIIDRPGKNIVLVLSSFPIVWNISSTPSTNIVQIISAFNGKNPLIKYSSNIPLYIARLPVTSSPDELDFMFLLSTLNRMLGITKIDSFYESSYIKPIITISEVSTNPKYSLYYPQTQKSPIDIKFDLMSSTGLVAWTPYGPVNSSSLSVYSPPESYILSKDGKYEYKIGNNSLIIRSILENSIQEYPIPSNFPRFSWAKGIAHCPDPNIVAITSYGGEGYFYRFNLNTKNWIDAQPQSNKDYLSLTYDPYTKHFLAISEGGENGDDIYELSLTGKPIKQYNNIYGKLIAYKRFFGNQEGLTSNLYIIPEQNHLVLLAFKGRLSNTQPESIVNEVGCIWVLDRQTGNAVLTYKNIP